MCTDIDSDRKPAEGYGCSMGRFVMANLLVGADGSTTVHGRSVGLSSPADRKRFHQLRTGADLIIIGGNTARNEPYATTPIPLIVLTHGALPDEVNSNPDAHAVKADIQRALNELSGNILIEAGPAIIQEATKAQLIDELYITVTRATPSENQINFEELIIGYREDSREEIDGEIFLRFVPALTQ